MSGSRPVIRSSRSRRFGLPGGWDVPAGGGVALKGQVQASDSELPLLGTHNALNLCGALTALEALGVPAPPPPPLAQALAGFGALPHRLERVAEHERLVWVDDSISTTPESTLAALASFPGRDVVLIGGGQDRGQDYQQLGRELAERGASVIGVPSTGARLIAAARAAGVPGARAIEASDMCEAVTLARSIGQAGGVVLLSPAAPSYDNYHNFEERGERFRALVARGRPDQR